MMPRSLTRTSALVTTTGPSGRLAPLDHAERRITPALPARRTVRHRLLQLPRAAIRSDNSAAGSGARTGTSAPVSGPTERLPRMGIAHAPSSRASGGGGDCFHQDSGSAMRNFAIDHRAPQRAVDVRRERPADRRVGGRVDRPP
jgi:hypothetical protein